MKRNASWATVAGLLWLLASGALAQGMQRQPHGRGEGGGPLRMMPVEQRDHATGGARDESPPEIAGRLSAEERRQLRRDVHEAGRDLYPAKGPRGRRELRQQ